MTLKNTGSNLYIGKMSRDDIPEIHKIEQECFSNPWPLSGFFHLLGNQSADCWVIRCEGQIVGYFIGLDSGGDYLIANLAVACRWRSRGLASLLLDHALKEIESREFQRAVLDVRPSNRKAIRLYSRFGFQAVARKKNYYSRPPEDSIVMAKRLGTDPATIAGKDDSRSIS